MTGVRRFQRYPVNLRLTLQFPTGQIETTTDEISEAGFSAPCPELPEVGTDFRFAVQLPDGQRITGKACAMRLGGSTGSAGFSCEFEPDQAASWATFLEQEHASGGLWRMIGRYASSEGDDQAASRSVVESAPGSMLRLHMVGENGEAYRLAFEKHASLDVDTAFAGAPQRTLEVARKAVTRALAQDVFLKRAPHAPVAMVRIVEMARGGYGFIDRDGGRMGVIGLHGSELLGIEANGTPLFPFFTSEELQRIANDTFRRAAPENAKPYASRTTPVPSPPREPPRQQHTPKSLSDAMDRSERVQMRVYQQRVLRLFPDVWLEVQRAAWASPARGFALQDGEFLCLFMLHGPDAPRVVRLQPGDAVFAIAPEKG